MTKQLEKVKKMYSILTVCLIFFGIMILSEPEMETEMFWKAGGVLLILLGIVKLFGYFSKDLLQLAFQFDFALGIISCLIGLAMLFRFGQLRNVLEVGIGLFMLADALLKIQTAIDAKKNRCRMLVGYTYNSPYRCRNRYAFILADVSCTKNNSNIDRT